VPGNHEKYTPIWTEFDINFSNYTIFFDFSSVIDEPGETELWYSFDYGGLHFCFLNTEYYWYDAGGGSMRFSCNATQLNWLYEDLSKTQLDDFIVVSFHRPAWSILLDRPDRWEEAESVRMNFHDLFVQYGVDLVFSGHDHYYYQTVRNEIYYFTTGGGGAPLHQADLGAPIWQEGDMTFSEHHFCNVEVQSTYLQIVAVGPDNTVYDVFRIVRPTTPTTPQIFPLITLENLYLIGLVVILAFPLIIVFLMLRKLGKSTRD
jgi:3',5'-cyclic AMP phosphodiesterase CpdA